ncbi:MAG: bifunctional 3'-5' exonuclease/DNA polymerase [Salinibacterium sp.]|nr:bifunctional 3'-5' exonuclease/DNA polymerase [Salinibacterium sp.]
MHIVLAKLNGGLRASSIGDAGELLEVEDVGDLAVFVAEREPRHPRWVWGDTSWWYPQLLAAGVRVDRCFDLRLCHAILRASSLTADSALAQGRRGPWDAPAAVSSSPAAAPGQSHSTLFDFETTTTRGSPVDPDPVAEFTLQRSALSGCAEPARLGRLLAAESAGALVAAEMRFAGLPWSEQRHDEILSEMLGSRPAADGVRPAKLQAVLEIVRERLAAPDLNPDSPAEIIRALGLAGVVVTSTRSWELKKLRHPAIEPLLEYKKLGRLLASNGWAWLDTWVTDGRFRPDYVPGGAATGRWATSGGGALQLPRQIRSAVIADDGWRLVVADASQLEPRILAAMAADRGMVEAGSAGDLYAGIVASGAVETRDQAKLAMLGAMYGATTGQSGRLMPKLARAYPRAIGLVEAAARAGERGEVVTTRLGRSSPPGSETGAWSETISAADATKARERSRAWGRFTRNFVVQGTAAEWALCWMASIRRRLNDLDGNRGLVDGPHLVFFLHDEVVVHTPAGLADTVAAEVTAAAAEAGRLLFGDLPAQFPLTVAIVDDYGQAK